MEKNICHGKEKKIASVSYHLRTNYLGLCPIHSFIIYSSNVPLLSHDYFMLSETWLTNDFNDNELGFINYNVFLYDRFLITGENNRGGSVAIRISKINNSEFINIPIKSVE
jgi:hypothetical protein